MRDITVKIEGSWTGLSRHIRLLTQINAQYLDNFDGLALLPRRFSM